MIFCVVNGPTNQAVEDQITHASLYADGIELRLDLFDSIDLTFLKKLRSKFKLPMIFTLRPVRQGGGFTRSEEDRYEEIKKLVALTPEFFDLEGDLPVSFVEDLHKKYPQVKLIISHHDFEKFPNLDDIYSRLKKFPATYYKIAVYTHTTNEALLLINWAKGKNVIAIGMGKNGEISRVIGSSISYAAMDDSSKTAPGQLLLKKLVEQCRNKTRIYGLIGDPVEQSISDVTHNSLMKELNLDAHYVKMNVQVNELPFFLKLAKTLPIDGLSVTAPLKEEAFRLCDKLSPEARGIRAVNTLSFYEGEIHGSNTDCMGALSAIEKKVKVKGKRVVVIGAGGASCGIVYETVRRGGIVTVLNRDEKRAEKVANLYGCIGRGLDYIKDLEYDILINATSNLMPIDAIYIRDGVYIMDVNTRPKTTPFLEEAIKKNCIPIYGYEMFIEQAALQFSRWFSDKIDIKFCVQHLEKDALEILK